MNIINKLTLRHLKENKKRTVVTIIGIIISVAMITATCVSVTSLIHVFAQSEAYTGGNWHIELENADAGQRDKLKSSSKTKICNMSAFAKRRNSVTKPLFAWIPAKKLLSASEIFWRATVIISARCLPQATKANCRQMKMKLL